MCLLQQDAPSCKPLTSVMGYLTPLLFLLPEPLALFSAI
jgi:hypothetical protein